MGISLKQAFIFVPKDSDWLKKVFIGGLLLFFPTFIYVFPGIKKLLFNPVNYYWITIFAILATTIFLAVSGYFFKAVHNRIVHSKEGLPEWKYFSYYVYVGLKSYVGGFLFSLPFLAVFLLLAVTAPMSPSAELIPFIIIGSVLHIIYTACYVMMALNFALDFKITSFFNVKKGYELIKGNLLNYIILVFYCLLLAMINTIVNAILVNGQIFSLFIPFVTFYVYLVYTDLFAQFVLNKTGLECHEQKCFI
ncbi:MAG: DUF4013 domain-containing protein [Clostridium sp.]|nr:DUF4013 domain-containing protein [Clostridium sp.]